jgi:hydroxymethylbilane synthase
MDMIRVGVRGSKLALAYAEKAVTAIGTGEVVIIKTLGDLNPDTPIHEIGGKGVFCSAIEEQLLNRNIDVAVHSLKDMPGDIEHPDLVVGAYLERSSPYDVILGKVFNGFTIGTSSPRRTQQLLDLYGYMNVKIKHIRGNIDTRLAKLDAGEFDALVLAEAGLQALSIARTTSRLPIVPAVGQGTIALQCRRDDLDTLAMLKHADHDLTRRQSFLERALLKGIMGDCSTSVAAFAQGDNPIKMSVVYY